MSRETIIADASCLIVLQNIQELQLLHELFGEIFITNEVKEEFGLDLPEWIKVKTVQSEFDCFMFGNKRLVCRTKNVFCFTGFDQSVYVGDQRL